jgi:hypothetical protein
MKYDDKDTLSNFDIERELKHVKKFNGVFSRDNLPRKMKNGYYVINSDVSTGPGVHWWAVINRPRDKESLFFDSFGTSPPPPVEKFMRSSGKGIVYNSNQLQDLPSNRCGWFCVHVIKELQEGKSFYDVLYSMTQEPSVKNEEKVKI